MESNYADYLREYELDIKWENRIIAHKKFFWSKSDAIKEAESFIKETASRDWSYEIHEDEDPMEENTIVWKKTCGPYRAYAQVTFKRKYLRSSVT